MKMRFALGVLTVSLLAAGPASAERQDHFTVRVHVVEECQIVAQDLNFGIVEPPERKTGQTVLNLHCTPGTSADVSIGDGLSGNRQRRFMQGPAELEYQLYRDAALRDPIDEFGASFVLKGRDNVGQVIPLEVYGEIPAGQQVPPGEYVDLILVTVQF
jgi:spore coat protein U-like protein